MRYVGVLPMYYQQVDSKGHRTAVRTAETRATSTARITMFQSSRAARTNNINTIVHNINHECNYSISLLINIIVDRVGLHREIFAASCLMY